MPAKTKTNATTAAILKYLFNAGIFAYRHNVLPIPVVRAGLFTGFRPGSKSGIPDIVGVIPAGLLSHLGGSQRFSTSLFVEIKTGRDKLRPEQIGFITTVTKMGAVVFVVKDYQDFLNQWDKFINERSEKNYAR